MLVLYMQSKIHTYTYVRVHVHLHAHCTCMFVPIVHHIFYIILRGYMTHNLVRTSDQTAEALTPRARGTCWCRWRRRHRLAAGACAAASWWLPAHDALPRGPAPSASLWTSPQSRLLSGDSYSASPRRTYPWNSAQRQWFPHMGIKSPEALRL